MYSSPPEHPATFSERMVQWLQGPEGWLAGAPVTRMIIWLNVVTFAAQLLVAHRPLALLNMPTTVVMAFGANYASATIAEHRFETLLSACFVHGSLLHILFNMLALRSIGPMIERAAGAVRMAVMYLLSGIAGSLVSALAGWAWSPQRLSVGASGAICGILGAAIVLGFRTQGLQSPLARSVGQWLFFTVLIGLAGGFDNYAHIGGAVAGAAIAALWRRGYVYQGVTRVVILVGCAFLVSGVAVAVVVHDWKDPYATMVAEERLVDAARAIEAGDCGRARRSLEATARLSPNAVEVEELRVAFKRACGSPFIGNFL